MPWSNIFLEDHPQHHIRTDNLPISVIGIEKVSDYESEEKELQTRIEREKFWIDTLVTWHPFGMNEDRMKWAEKYNRKTSPVIPFIVPFCYTGNKPVKSLKHITMPYKTNTTTYIPKNPL